MNEMTIEQVELLVTRQLDGRITDDELVELEELLASNPAAARLARALRGDHQALCAALAAEPALQGAAPAPAPATLTLREAAPVDDAPQTIRPAAWWRRIELRSAAAAAVAVLVGGGLAFWSAHRTQPVAPGVPGPAVAQQASPAPGDRKVIQPSALAGHSLVAHDTGEVVGVVPNDPQPASRKVYGVQDGDSVLVIEVPQPAPQPRY